MLARLFIDLLKAGDGFEYEGDINFVGRTELDNITGMGVDAHIEPK